MEKEAKIQNNHFSNSEKKVTLAQGFTTKTRRRIIKIDEDMGKEMNII